MRSCGWRFESRPTKLERLYERRPKQERLEERRLRFVYERLALVIRRLDVGVELNLNPITLDDKELARRFGQVKANYLLAKSHFHKKRGLAEAFLDISEETLGILKPSQPKDLTQENANPKTEITRLKNDLQDFQNRVSVIVTNKGSNCAHS